MMPYNPNETRKELNKQRREHIAAQILAGRSPPPQGTRYINGSMANEVRWALEMADELIRQIDLDAR